MDGISFGNVIVAAQGHKKAAEGEAPASKWNNVRTNVSLTGGKIAGFLVPTKAHVSRHEQQTRQRMRHERQKAFEVGKAKRKTKGLSASMIAEEHQKNKKGLVQQQISKQPFHEKVAQQLLSESTPRFMRLTENQADRASLTIRKRQDFEGRKIEYTKKETRVGEGLTNSDIADINQPETRQFIEKQIRKAMLEKSTLNRPAELPEVTDVEAASATAVVPADDGSTTVAQFLCPQPPAREQASSAMGFEYVYSFMRPTHSSQLHTRPSSSIEYNHKWLDKQYLKYNKTVNSRTFNRTPRPYLTPQPPVILTRKNGQPPDFDTYFPRMTDHLHKCAIVKRSPVIAGMKKGRDMRAATARGHVRQKQPQPDPFRGHEYFAPGLPPSVIASLR